MSSEISPKTKLLGVIGNPIEHSMSPAMHNAAIQALHLDYRYLAFQVLPERLQEAIQGMRALNISGLNITIPHKEKVMPYLDEIEETAAKIGAINTIKNVKGRLIGRNTDGEGAIAAIKGVGWKLDRSNVVIIGSGGAARAISFVLAKLVPRIIILYQIKDQAEKLVAELEKQSKATVIGAPLDEDCTGREIQEADIMINATPVGMFPNLDKSVISKKCLHSDLNVFDIVYNPLQTQLLKDAKEIGCATLSGINMLVNQGALAFEWWTGVVPDKEIMKQAAIKALGL